MILFNHVNFTCQHHIWIVGSCHQDEHVVIRVIECWERLNTLNSACEESHTHPTEPQDVNFDEHHHGEGAPHDHKVPVPEFSEVSEASHDNYGPGECAEPGVDEDGLCGSNSDSNNCCYKVDD